VRTSGSGDEMGLLRQLYWSHLRFAMALEDSPDALWANPSDASLPPAARAVRSTYLPRVGPFAGGGYNAMNVRDVDQTSPSIEGTLQNWAKLFRKACYAQ
jgi:hypothetical protein